MSNLEDSPKVRHEEDSPKVRQEPKPAPIDSKAVVQPNPPPLKWDTRHIVLGVAALFFGIMTIWLWTGLNAAKSQGKSQLLTSEQQGQERLEGQKLESQRTLSATREEAALQQASAFATAIQPIMSLKGQVPEISDRTIQAATKNLAQLGEYSFVSVTDADGRVIGSSDLTIIGQDFSGNLAEGVSTVNGQNQAVAAISSDGGRFGFVVIRINK